MEIKLTRRKFLSATAAGLALASQRSLAEQLNPHPKEGEVQPKLPILELDYSLDDKRRRLQSTSVPMVAAKAASVRHAEGSARAEAEVKIPKDAFLGPASTNGHHSAFTAYSFSERTSHIATVDYDSHLKRSFLHERRTEKLPRWFQAVAISPTDPSHMAAALTDPFSLFGNVIYFFEDEGRSYTISGFPSGSDGGIKFSDDGAYVFTIPGSSWEGSFLIKQMDPKKEESSKEFELKLANTDWLYDVTSPHPGENGIYTAQALTYYGFRTLTFTKDKLYTEPHHEYPGSWKLQEVHLSGGEKSVWLLNNRVITPVDPNPPTLPEDISAIGTIIENTYGQYTAYYQPKLALYNSVLSDTGYTAQGGESIRKSRIAVHSSSYNPDEDAVVMGITVMKGSSQGYSTIPFVEIVSRKDNKHRLLPRKGLPEHGYMDEVIYVKTDDGKRFIRAVISTDAEHSSSTLVELDITHGYDGEWNAITQMVRAAYLPGADK